MDPLPIPNIHFRFIKGYTTSKDLKVPKHLSCNFFGAAGDIWSYEYLTRVKLMRMMMEMMMKMMVSKINSFMDCYDYYFLF